MDNDTGDTAALHHLRALAAEVLSEDLSISERGTAIGRFYRCDVTSAFQPIFYAEDGHVAGYQALVRVYGPSGDGLSPWGLFSMAADDDDLVLLDRRCRLIHTINFLAAHLNGAVLQLGVHDRLLTAVARDHGREFRRVLDLLGVDRSRITIVLPSLPWESDALCSQVLASYHDHGFCVAVTPRDSRQLDSLLARVAPDVARIDARLLHVDPQWPKVLNRARAACVRIQATRVETVAQRALAVMLGATTLQGMLLGAPVEHPRATARDAQAA